ncbi:EF-hand domain-containing protein [Delftia acidovorans]|uniref:EF-hand domain-containing protein n=1 Tax=Delftia acidovorans TaxID=80866 RepID=UPI0035A0270D
MHFPIMNRSALLRRPPLLQAAVVVLLTSAFMLPAARAQAAENAATEQATASPAPLTKGEIKAQREFKMLDFNKDGKLSRAEVALFPRLSAAFDEADTDKDGYVSYAEVQAFAVKYRAERDKAKAKAQAEEAKAAERAAAEHAAAAPAARDKKEGEGSKD